MLRLAGFGLKDDNDEHNASRLQTGQFTVDRVGPSLIETSGRAPHPDISPCPHDSGGPYFRQPKGRTRSPPGRGRCGGTRIVGQLLDVIDGRP